MQIKALLTLLLLSPISNVSAAQNDFEKEVVINAKRQSSDLKNKIASYIEDVKITQGTLTIEADIVQVANEKGSENKYYLAKGTPAKFSQLLDDGQLIELKADEINYSPATNTITIKGNASVSQAGSKVTGDIIIYNTLSEQLTAESTESVTTILKPELKDPIKNLPSTAEEQQK